MITLLKKSAEELNAKFAEVNKKYGKILRTDFKEGEEIRLTNVFTKEKYGYDSPLQFYLGQTFLVDIIEGAGTGVSTTDYEESVFVLEFVLELQHALRLCGLNELADNFKIN